MKKSELQKIIKEEIQKVQAEAIGIAMPIRAFKASVLAREFAKMGFPINKTEAYTHITAGPVLSVEFKNPIDVDKFYAAYEDLQYEMRSLPDITDGSLVGKNKYIFNTEK
jgi:hypothetical protein